MQRDGNFIDMHCYAPMFSKYSRYYYTLKLLYIYNNSSRTQEMYILRMLYNIKKKKIIINCKEKIDFNSINNIL